MAKSSRATPSAGRRGPDPLTVSGYGASVATCRDCACVPTATVATSTRAPLGATRFDVEHLVDGNPSSVWCAGDRADEPAAVTFTIPSGCAIEGMAVLGGHFGSRRALAEHGRAVRLRLGAGRRDGEAVLEDPVDAKPNLKAMITKPAYVRVGWPSTDTLRVTFPGVAAGSAHPRVCLSELRPLLSGASLED